MVQKCVHCNKLDILFVIPVSVMVTGSATVSAKFKGRYGPGSPPRFAEELRPVVFWNITRRCNLFCKHCYIRAGPDQGDELSEEDVARIADELVGARIPLVIFTGGEPLASKLFWLAAERLSGRVRLALSSNGTLITRDVARRLRELGFSYVGVSIDDVDPVLHDEFRGLRGAFRAAINGIRIALEEGLDVGIRTTLTRSNISRVGDILGLARDLGVRRVALYLLDAVGRGRDLLDEAPSREQVLWLSNELIRLAEKFSDMEIVVVRGNFIGVLIALELAKRGKDLNQLLSFIEAEGDCGRKSISIYPDGTVRPCQFLENVIIGDLKRQSLRDILKPDNPALRPFLEAHKYLRGPKCSACMFKEVCGGGSRGRAEAWSGDFWGDDPLCPL